MILHAIEVKTIYVPAPEIIISWRRTVGQRAAFLSKFKIQENTKGDFRWKILEVIKEIPAGWAYNPHVINQLQELAHQYAPFLCTHETEKRPFETLFLTHPKLTHQQAVMISNVNYPVCFDWIRDHF